MPHDFGVRTSGGHFEQSYIFFPPCFRETSGSRLYETYTFFKQLKNDVRVSYKERITSFHFIRLCSESFTRGQ